MNRTPHSLTPPAVGLAPAAGHSHAAKGVAEEAAPLRWTEIVNLCDPEWLPFVLPLLLPALVCLSFGQFQRASFFAGAALYLGVLKWLGWLVLMRWTTITPRFLLWPAELFAGLAVLIGWFYLRNLAGWLWPGSYSLVELKALPVLIVGLHLTVGLFKLRPSLLGPDWRQAIGLRIAMIGPFVLALVVAVSQVSGSLGVQAVDPVLHAYQAKVYLHDGLLHPVGPDHLPLRYPSGFAAINAVTAGVSTLTTVQAVNLQHILWIIVGLFLATGAVAALARRPLPLLHFIVLPFLVLFPIYGLFPDYGYSGTPRQMAPPLLLAVALLPALAPIEKRSYRLALIFIVAILAVVTLVLNPICAPFALAAVMVATIVYGVRTATSLRQFTGAATAMALALSLAAVLLLGCDRHYASYLSSPEAAAPPGEPKPELPSLKLSAGDAFRAMLAVNPVDLTPTVMLAEEAYPNPQELHWTERFPQRLMPWLAGLLGVVALVAMRRGGNLAPEMRSLALLLLGCAAMWLLLKWGVALATGAVTSGAWKAEMFQVYLKTILTRIELMLVFTTFAASCALLALTVQQNARRAQLLRQLWPLGLVGLALLSLSLAWGPHPKSGYFSMPAGSAYAITAEDRDLAAWIDDNIPAGQGLIGLAATTFSWGPEKHVYALGGAQAVVQYGKHDNFRFGLRALERNQGYEDYVANVRDRFNGEWCEMNGIHYFFVDSRSLKWNPGLARAIAAGELKVVRQAGDSAIYEITGGMSP